MADVAPIGDPTREALIESAAAVFSEKGYDGAGVQEIARRAGFTTGAIYGRFSGKAQLLLAAIEMRTESELERLFREQFAGTVDNALAVLGSHLVTDPFNDGQALLLEAFVAARRDPEVAELVRELMAKRSETFAALIQEAKDKGVIDLDVDTASLVRFCHAVGFGFLMFGAIDMAGLAVNPWDDLIGRLIGSLSPEA